MRISAIVLNYFGWQDTTDCCRALAGQLDKIIVVENSMSLREQQELIAACSAISTAEVLISDKNLGFAGGVNFALRQMLPLGFDAFLLINNDTVVPDDLIEKLSRGASAAALDIASPVIYRYPEKDRLWSKGNYYNVWSGFVTDKPLPLPGNFFYLPGCCLLIKKGVFEAIGLFNEAFFMYGEDVEFCHRATAGGVRIGIVPEARMYHKAGAASVQNSVFYEQHINKAHLQLSQKLFTARPAQRLSLCLKIIALLLRSIIRSFRFRNLNAFQGYGAALRWCFFQGTGRK